MELEPTDRSDIHFRLAKALNKLGDKSRSKRHVLMALEESPRYVEALELFANLVQIESNQNDSTKRDPQSVEEPTK
jgi:hypothetical protein